MLDFLKVDMPFPPEVISCGKLVAEGEFIHPDRNLDSNLLIIGIKNNLYLLENEIPYQVSEKSSLLLEPFKRHFPYAPSYDISYYWCHFYWHKKTRIEFWDRDTATALYHKMAYTVRKETDMVLIPKSFELLQCEKLYILFRQLLHNSYGNNYTKNAANFCLGMILIELTQQAIEFYSQNPQQKSFAKFSEIDQWIKMNLDKDIKIRDIAEHFHYNNNYLSNMFKCKIGLSLLQYTQKLKIAKASEYLMKTDKTVKEIAYELGFSDCKYFMKIFKKHTALTPTQYRNGYYSTHLNKK